MKSETEHRMTMKEFQETGCVQEVNRRLLHPRGLALIVVNHYADDDPEHKGPIKRWSFGGIMDYRSDPEGIAYSPKEWGDPVVIERFHAFEALATDLRETRQAGLGYVIQEIPKAFAEGGPPSGAGSQIAHWQALWSRAVSETRTATARVVELERLLEEGPKAAAEASAPLAGMDETGWDEAQPRASFLALRSLFVSQERELARAKRLLEKAEKGEEKPTADYGTEPETLEPSAELVELMASYRDALAAGFHLFTLWEGTREMVYSGEFSFEEAKGRAEAGEWDREIHLSVTAGQDRRGTS